MNKKGGYFKETKSFFKNLFCIDVKSALFRIHLLQKLFESRKNIYFEAIQNSRKSNCAPGWNREMS